MAIQSRSNLNAPARAVTSERTMRRYVLDLLPAILAPFLGIAAALLIIILILQWQGADPKIAWDYVYEGTLETAEKRADLVAFWMPLAITSFGLVLTYNAGLWNIGVEGQMIMGAIGATWAVRLFAEYEAGQRAGLTDLGHTPVLIMCFIFGGAGRGALGGGGGGAQNARRRQRDFWRRGAELHRADV